jgi:DNA-binding winged helix-turn-helix (wHTH) protein/tetratricopeptide (TPR) repeat protein
MHLDRASRELIVGDRRTRLADRPFRVLMALIDAEGAVVTRETLRSLLWSDDTFVDFDNNLNSAVATLRQALGDSARTPRYIETIPKVGYRLIRSPVARATRPRLAITVAASVALVIVLVAVSAGLVWRTPRPDPAAVAADFGGEARAHFERGVYLRGQFLATRANPDQLTHALAAFEQALGMEPRFAAAAAEHADTLVETSFAGAVSFRDGLERARASARGALALAPTQATAARVMALTTLFLDWNFAASRGWLDRAGEARVDAKTALAEATWLAAAGQPDAAVAAAERAVALDPAAYYVRADLAMFYLAAGRHEDAVENSRRVLAAAPEFAPAMHLGLLACERLGRWDDAAAFARALMDAGGAPPDALAALANTGARDAVSRWRRWDLARLERQAAGRRADYALQLGLRRAELGDRAAAMDDLELALARRDPLLAFVRAFPELAALQGDPRFESIVRAVTAL